MLRLTLVTLAATLISACAEPPPATVEEHAFRLLEDAGTDFPALNATVIVNGEIVWEATAGELIGENDSPTANYNVYSVAKMITGMAYARLASVDGLSLDQSVREVDPGLPEHLDSVTLRQLLAHVAGIRGYTSDEDWETFANMRCQYPADALAHFIDDPLATEPGEKYQYTTYGFALLSHLLVQMTGTDSFDAAMGVALGELYTATTDSDDVIKTTNYDETLFGFTELEGINAQCKFGGGGLVTSARSLARMGSAWAAGDIVDADTLAEWLAPTRTSNGEEVNYTFGMGVGVVDDLEPATRYAAHSGGSPGGRSYMLVLFEPGIAVGLSTNSDGPGLGEVAFAIAKVFAER